MNTIVEICLYNNDNIISSESKVIRFENNRNKSLS
jgi:hypothetical protein